MNRIRGRKIRPEEKLTTEQWLFKAFSQMHGLQQHAKQNATTPWPIWRLQIRQVSYLYPMGWVQGYNGTTIWGEDRTQPQREYIDEECVYVRARTVKEAIRHCRYHISHIRAVDRPQELNPQLPDIHWEPPNKEE